MTKLCAADDTEPLIDAVPTDVPSLYMVIADPFRTTATCCQLLAVIAVEKVMFTAHEEPFVDSKKFVLERIKPE
tara:strand:- start:373 stop:594 length:222 start_codon:yes stop_codon:yes gene_type:complete